MIESPHYLVSLSRLITIPDLQLYITFIQAALYNVLIPLFKSAVNSAKAHEKTFENKRNSLGGTRLSMVVLAALWKHAL